MVSATLTKVREIKHAADARPVVLLGWGVGAAIAAHVAGMERLAGLVSFSLVSLNFVFVDVDGLLMQVSLERCAWGSQYRHWLDCVVKLATLCLS